MNARERYLKTFAHELPDRVPAKVGFRPEVIRALCEHFQADWPEVVRKLGAEGWSGVAPASAEFPGWNHKPKEAREGDWPGGGTQYFWHDERTFEDCWGTVRRVGRDEKYVEWIDGPLTKTENLDAIPWPTYTRSEEAAAEIQRKKGEGNIVVFGVTQPYKLAWEIRGMENLLMDYLINRPFIEKLYDRIYEMYTPLIRWAAEDDVDVFSIGGDIAMQDRMIMGARTWREVDKPRLAALIAEGKKIKPDLHIFIHSDGDLREIMDDLIEIGFDIIDPIQPECMPPNEVKEQWGDRITLCGTGSLQHTLPFGTVDDVRAEVSDRIVHCGYNGGLILRPANAVGFDVPLENLLAFYETAMEFDYDALRETAGRPE